MARMKADGKIAIVTGASGGIGEATAKLLVQKGAKVALVARRREELAKISKDLAGSKYYVCDLSKPGEIKKNFPKIISDFGGVDILVNNAGRGYDARIENIKPETFRKIFELDVLGYIMAMQAVIPSMRKRGGGAIVNISSGTALFPLPNMAGYAGLKRAVAGISLGAREELKNDGISISVVYPYITDTDFEKNTLVEGELKWAQEEEQREIPPADSAEYAAKIVLKAIEAGEAEVFAHEWMKNGNRS